MHLATEMANAIESLRRGQGVDAIEFARRLKVSPSTAKRWIRYRYGRCSLVRIQEIVDALFYPKHTFTQLKKLR